MKQSCIPTNYLSRYTCSHLRFFFFNITTFCPLAAAVKAEDELDVDGTVEEDLGKSRDGSRTDDEVVER